MSEKARGSMEEEAVPVREAWSLHQHLFISTFQLKPADTLHTKHSHTGCLIGTPLSPTPSRTNRQIPPSGIIQPLLHLLPEGRQSSARCPGDTLTPSCCAGASASFWFSRTGSWASVNAARYLQVLANSLEELIKSILLLGLVWIHLLTSVSNISGMFILLSSWNTAYKVMKEMCTECTKENWVLP